MATNDPTAGHLGLGIQRVPERVDDVREPGPNMAVEGLAMGAGLGGSMRCSICRTASDLAAAMQRQSSGSLTGLGFLPVLGAKMGFYSSLRTTVFSLSVVVHAWRVTGSARLSHPRLRADLSPPRTEEELKEFVTLYGDSYLSSVEMGGECFGVFTFRAESREQAERVEKALGVGGVINGLQIGANFNSALESASRASAVNASFSYQVWGVSDSPALTPDALVPYALGFSNSSIDKPILLDLATKGYETVPEIGTAFLPVAANRDLFTRREGLLRKRQRLQELINQMDHTDRTLAVYGVTLPDLEVLANQRHVAESDLDRLDGLMSTYHANPAAPLQEPELPSLAVGSPRLWAKVKEEPATRIDPTRGAKGEPFPFPFERSTAVQHQVRLTGIGLEAGWRVDKLRLRYSSNLSGQEVVEESHGGDRGNDLGDITFGPGEGVTAIYSEFGTNIDRLRLETDQGVLESTGDQGDKQRPVNWTRAPGEVVLGFSGRADDLPTGALYGLQAVVARFEEIVWEPIDRLDQEDG